MTTVTNILDDLQSAAEEDDDVTVHAMTEQLGNRGVGALLLVPALLEMTPIGGIPGVPTALAVIIALFAVQIAFGRSRMWLPGFLDRRSVSSKKLKKAIDLLRKPAEWSDRHLGRSLTVLVDKPAPQIAAVAIIGLCATVPALELLPFASMIPMVTISLFGLAFVVRDGRVMALGWIAFAASVWSLWALWP